MLRHPEAFAALTSVRVRLSDLLDRESREEMLEVCALAEKCIEFDCRGMMMK